MVFYYNNSNIKLNEYDVGKAYANMVVGEDPKLTVSSQIKLRLNEKNKRYFVCDNISDEIKEGEIELLIDEVTEKFQGVLDSLVIDTKNDPNSYETARRMAKSYINELFYGRYFPAPDVKAFPNDGSEAYRGMMIAPAEIKSMCSHHHQAVNGMAYIGVIPGHKVIGLSKFSRIAWHEARRGTLQEELTQRIMRRIMEETESQDVAVYIEAKHSCMSCRGVLAHDSLTQTCSISGQFNDSSVKAEFFQQIQMRKK